MHMWAGFCCCMGGFFTAAPRSVCRHVQGYISYPRTETTRYPSDFDFRSILSGLSRHNEFGEYASSILKAGVKSPRLGCVWSLRLICERVTFTPTLVLIYSSGGADVGDHPPITPMRSATRDQLRDSEWKLYDFVTRHFLATVRSLLLLP